MKIIILGAGQVGVSLAHALTKDEHEVTLVDENEPKLEEIQERLDLMTVTGHCSYPSILSQAGADDADMIIAVTDSDEINMVACQIAYSMFDVPTKLARIRSKEYFKNQVLFDPDHIPVDFLISPEQLITEHVSQLLEFPGTLQVLDFGGGQIKMVAVKSFFGGALVGRTIQEIYAEMGDTPMRIVALYRGESTILVKGELVVEAGDEIFFIAAKKHVQDIVDSFRKKENDYKRIIIGGGGNIGSALAAAIADDYQVKLIEGNRRRCEYLAENLENVTVLHGEVADKTLLVNENIEYTDVFFAVTNDDEANIIASLQAKRLGARQVMAIVTRTAYIDLIEGNAINVAISPQQTTISSILGHLRHGDFVHVHTLRHGAAEVVEAVAHGDAETSRVVGRTISQLKLPKSCLIGAILRGDEVLIPAQQDEIQEGDHVIIHIGERRQTRDIERLFEVGATFI